MSPRPDHNETDWPGLSVVWGFLFAYLYMCLILIDTGDSDDASSNNSLSWNTKKE